MSTNRALILVLTLVQISLPVLASEINGKIVPPLYRYDGYESCLQRNSSAVYCTVKVVFHLEDDPFNTSRIVSSFRRNLLDWGVCVQECEREVAKLAEEDRQQLYTHKFPINFTYLLSTDYGSSATAQMSFHLQYAELLNVCINNRLQRDYNFTRHAYPEFEYCTGNEGPGTTARGSSPGEDWLMMAFCVITVMLIGLVVGANVADWMGRPPTKEHIVVSSFSVRRNWTRLLEQPSGELYGDLGYIDGLRVFVSVLVMAIHCLMVSGIFPLQNPEYTEDMLLNPLMVEVTSPIVISVQIFFVISGILLMTTVLRDMRQKPKLEEGYFWSKICNRLIRIVPVYYFFLLVAAVGSDLPGVYLGPSGFKLLIQEQILCREKWWTNVLFVNNLPFVGYEKCALQGWYLATDQQLFLAALLLLGIIWKAPWSAKWLLWVVAAISVVIPTIIIYELQLESSIPLRLSDMQFLFMHQDWFNHIYQPSYSNLNSYIAGMTVGYVYHQVKHHEFDLDHSRLYKFVKCACLPLLVLAYGPTFLFYKYEIPRSSWFTVTHFVLFRNAGVIVACVGFISCFKNPPGRIRRFLSSQSMTSIGKLSYSVYVLHVPVFRILMNWLPTPIYLTLSGVFLLLTAVTLLSYLLGLVVYLCLEQPMSLLLKYYVQDSKKGQFRKGFKIVG